MPFSNSWRAVAGAALASTLVLVPGAAQADGGLVPSQSPTITLGVTNFGDNSDYSCDPSTCRIDFWKLPPLLAQDVVTVAWKLTDLSGPVMCLEGAVDDFSWNQSLCNMSEYVYGNEAGQRTTLVADQSADPAYLTFRDQDCFGSCGNYGPYQFTVESIQHALGLSLSKPSGKSVSGTAYLSNGQPVPDGVVVPLVVRRGQASVTLTAASKAGKVSYTLKLPRQWKGKAVSIHLSRSADSSYLDAQTTPQVIRVK